jgi:hypothetical protein
MSWGFVSEEATTDTMGVRVRRGKPRFAWHRYGFESAGVTGSATVFATS